MFYGQFLIVLLVTAELFSLAYGITWWSAIAQVALQRNPELLFLSAKPFCAQLTGLSPGQARICELFSDHMSAVARGTAVSIAECQKQFSNRRWNCSEAGIFGPINRLATAEAAFTDAIVAAGITHEISRSCRTGELSSCGCSSERRPPDLSADWKWGGCGDNINYGSEFATNFIDIREREQSMDPSSMEHARSLMNRWNNEVGRTTVRRAMKLQCKCHGVSAACNLKTCWRSLGSMPDVGAQLLRKHDTAVRVRLNRRGNLQLMTLGSSRVEVEERRQKRTPKLELVFLDESPDYCHPNTDFGIPGTSGRVCNRDGTGPDSCELLCCGRGYNTFTKVNTEKCQCKFEWCCKVVCKICQTYTETHVCK